MRQPGDRVPAPGALGLVQDFVNTWDIEGGHDSLLDVAGLHAFCAAHGLPPADNLVESRELREAVRDACAAHVGVPLDPRRLNRLLSRGALTVAVDETGAATLTAGDGLVAALAAAITDDRWPRLKACAAHECRWVYYDHSPAGRSRWCTMSICGSRAKMREYRRKAG